MLLSVALAVMSNRMIQSCPFRDLSRMMFDNDFPALEQALNEGADVNMLNDEVDSSNLVAN